MHETRITRDDVVRESDKAILVTIDRTASHHFDQSNREAGRAYHVWLPKSAIAWQATIYGEHLMVAPWLAKKL